MTYETETQTETQTVASNHNSVGATLMTETPEEALRNRRFRDLMDMLSYRRKRNSKTERRFIGRFIYPLGARFDGFGNLVVEVGEGSKVLWSCHTDSVHYDSGIQKVEMNYDTAMASVGDKSNCLGADCAVGVWIMREMILAHVPGTYIFHREEECGGRGSNWIAENKPEWLKGFQYAIAFDRRNTHSVITHQGGVRTASDDFAESIAPMLPGKYTADTGGIFTDTENYREIIPECTNLSVGYYDEHTSRERLDVLHALDLVDAMCTKFDESKLVCKRDPKVEEFDDWYGNGYGKGYEPSSWNKYGYTTWEKDKAATKGSAFPATSAQPDDKDEWAYNDRRPTITLLSLIKYFPEEVADFLEHSGIDAKTLSEEINARCGADSKLK